MKKQNKKPMPVYIPMGKVPKWVKVHLHINIHRRTVYNWAIKGLSPKGTRTPEEGGEKVRLQRKVLGTRQYTTEEWLEDFFRKVN